MFDYIFAFVHLGVLIGVLAYAVNSLVQGNTLRFALIAACLCAYYFLVLHKAVKKEIARKKRKA